MAVQSFPHKAIDANPGGSAFESEPIDIGNFPWGSFQVNWAGLGGTPNGTVALETSSVPEPGENDWVAKHDQNGNPVVITVDGADGAELASLNSVLGEAWARLVYDPGTTTGGTITAYFHGKKGTR